MEKGKKILSVLLIALMLLPTASFALEDQAKPSAAAVSDVQIAKELGILKGGGNGVTPEYLSRDTQRIQAAIMLLRLRGLEAEARAFTGKDTFEDEGLVQYQEGKNILAYLKAHPEYGFTGYTDGKFGVTDKIQLKQFYKVLLTTLGYKQGADFNFADVQTFAAAKGLSKVATKAELTNNDLATATVEALRAKTKDGTVLSQKLIDQGIISSEVSKILTPPTIEVKEDPDKVRTFRDKDPTPALDTSIPASIQSVDATTVNTLRLNLVSGNQIWSVDKTKIKFFDNVGNKPDVAQLTVTDAVKQDDTHVLLTLSSPLKEDAKALSADGSLGVYFDAEALTFKNGQKSQALDKESAFTAQDRIVPFVENVYVKKDAGDGHYIVIVQFKEQIFANLETLASKFVIRANGDPLNAESDYTAAIVQNRVELSIKNADLKDKAISVDLSSGEAICDNASGKNAFDASSNFAVAFEAKQAVIQLDD